MTHTHHWILMSYLFHRDSEIVAQFLPMVLNLPDNCHIAVRKTSIKLVGELSEWVNKHPDVLGKDRKQWQEGKGKKNIQCHSSRPSRIWFPFLKPQLNCLNSIIYYFIFFRCCSPVFFIMYPKATPCVSVGLIHWKSVPSLPLTNEQALRCFSTGAVYILLSSFVIQIFKSFQPKRGLTNP